MKSYTVKRIAQELNIDRAQAYTIRQIVRGELNREALYALSPRVEKWAEQECYNRPSLREVAMETINDIMRAHGIESIEKPDAHGDGRYSDYIDYINTGDTYSTTILRDGSRYWIGTYGDTTEKLERTAAHY